MISRFEILQKLVESISKYYLCIRNVPDDTATSLSLCGIESDLAFNRFAESGFVQTSMIESLKNWKSLNFKLIFGK